MRKTSQAALLVLLEQGLISKADMESKVCPVLLDLTEPSSDDDYKIEAVAVSNLNTIVSRGGFYVSELTVYHYEVDHSRIEDAPGSHFSTLISVTLSVCGFKGRGLTC